MDAVTVNMLDDAAKRYTARFRSSARGATRVTDKLPTNFLNVGLIAQMLPGARIIHCNREPMDTCWSNYAMHFTDDLPFARNLTDLGRYYRDEQRLMDHYKQVLDLPILDVQYEQLVEDIEGQSRRMLDFLDLNWDDRVLRYYEQDRRILTASADQANKPVYTSSIGRHKPYLPMLDEVQFDWLKSELDATPAQTPILILSHVPIISVGPFFFYDDIVENYQFRLAGALMHQDTHRLKGLLEQYSNVRLCLSGHVHLLDRVEYNGITYISNGSVSGSWWHGDYKQTPPGYGLVHLFDDGSFEADYIQYPWDSTG